MRERDIQIERQSGATLVVALIMLVILMMLGITAVLTSNTQFKLAGNLQFENAAKNSAENQIAIAEDWLQTGSNALDPCFSNNCFLGKLYKQGSLGTTDPKTKLTSSSDYIIERLLEDVTLPGSEPCSGNGAISDLNLYRITARGSDGRGATRYIQSIYQIRVLCSAR